MKTKYLPRTGGKKVTTSVQITREKLKILNNISEKEKRSVSALVNEALEKHFFG